MSCSHLHILLVRFIFFVNYLRYLELADWVLKDAVESAKEDHEWESEMDDTGVLRSGQIRITSQQGCLFTQGAGIKSSEGVNDDKKKKKTATPTSSSRIATKTVQLEDVYRASTQHESFGVELKPLGPSSSMDQD